MGLDTGATARIALVRHARSSHVASGWTTCAGVRAWQDAYAAAGIREDERAPEELAAWVDAGAVVLCSDSPRAVASARRLAGDREMVSSALLRELELDVPDLGGFRLPFVAWGLVARARSLLARRGRFPTAAESARIREAADWLDALSARHDRVVVVTHALFRSALASRLAPMRWKAEPGRRSWRPWSAWHFSRAREGHPRERG